ncbi:MAG: hypothetical protein IJI68_12605 [Eggerthellaceae bacterium]|nr:hypothetical protein [Eggerthellaceae bacterium]
MSNRLIGSSVLVGGAAALSLLASGVVAQEAGSPSAAQGEAAPKADPAAVNARQNRTDDQAVAGFLNRQRERQARREAALSRRGNAADQQELRRLYRALNIPRPNPRAQISAANQSALAESFETDSIQLLQSLNFKPARIRRLSDAGLNPLQAAAAYTRGTATVTEYALLSDVVAVARVVEVRNERLGDGFRSTVLLEITDSILGRAPNRPIALRQRSGEDENGQTLRVTSDLQAVDGQSYLVMLSAGLYEQLATEGAGNPAASAQGAARNYVQLGPTYLVQGDTLTPVDTGEVSPTTLSQLKATLAPVARARNTADDAAPAQETVR